MTFPPQIQKIGAFLILRRIAISVDRSRYITSIRDPCFDRNRDKNYRQTKNDFDIYCVSFHKSFAFSIS